MITLSEKLIWSGVDGWQKDNLTAHALFRCLTNLRPSASQPAIRGFETSEDGLSSGGFDVAALIVAFFLY